jgi:hypothetical protein
LQLASLGVFLWPVMLAFSNRWNWGISGAPIIPVVDSEDWPMDVWDQPTSEMVVGKRLRERI